jgi:putative PIN family toxin of toxin-antitoxin system
MNPTAVFDTVVLLQGGAKPDGPSGACLRLVLEGGITLFVSAEGMAEIEDVLRRDKTRARFPSLTPEAVDVFLRGLREKAVLAKDAPTIVRLSRDPDDEHILNLAVAVGAQFLVTRDKDLLDLMGEGDPDGATLRRQCPKLAIVDPVAFLTAVRPPESGPTPPRPTAGGQP